MDCWICKKYAANIWNLLPRPADSSEFIMVKLKRDLKYWGYVYFESVHLNLIYQALKYLKRSNKIYEYASISESLASKEMISFSGTDEHQDVSEGIHKILILHKTEYGSVEELSYKRIKWNSPYFRNFIHN